ncbi:unnamed protein product [Effrenium voratum]|nr:unnamed protein product [Effrenium voratum]
MWICNCITNQDELAPEVVSAKRFLGASEDERKDESKPLYFPMLDVEDPIVPPDDPTASPSADDQSDDIIDAEPAADVYLAKFQVSLGEPLGLDFDICDPGMLLVSGVQDLGPAQRWNSAAFKAAVAEGGTAQCVQRLHRVLAVDGKPVEVSKEFVEALNHREGEVRLQLQRPALREVTLEPLGAKLGLALSASKGSTSIFVRRFDPDGLVAAKCAKNEAFLRVHDRIIEINGQASDCADMARKFAEQVIHLKLYRFSSKVVSWVPIRLRDASLIRPPSWKQCPSEGIFSGRYTCAPENRDVNFRRRLAETYGYYDSKIMAGVTEQDIKWWTGLTEPPPDVLDLLEFMISRFQNCDEAFWKIVGLSDVKTQLITLRNFSAALKAMECGKFKGADETQRLQAIFRYLDPGGEGSISFNEWRVLGQLWNEFDLTIREFVQFLQIAFGEDLQDAWSALDDDGSGELSEQEWDEAVAKIGYFGPSRVIFALLDGSDDGDISVTEFEVLEKYKPPPKEEP